MAIGLEGHTVSLTKNGYFKLAELIKKYPSQEILSHLDEISLDFTQARKMLAGNSKDELPSAWDKVKEYDESSQYALLLISIIYSHKDLIELFKNSTKSEMQGVIIRNAMEVKTYTNLAFALNAAGVALDFKEGAAQTTYDLAPVFSKNEIGPLAKEIIMGHLENMGWKEPTLEQPFQRTFFEQCESYGFNKVLGISFTQFRGWLNGENVLRQNTTLVTIDPSIFMDVLKTSISSTGLYFSDQILSRLVSSLCTKPFLILSGLSGSGKTKLAQSFAQWICQDESQYCIVPVGADWTNREPLLGYPNALDPLEYIKPESGSLDLIIRANENTNLPYFLILDEMNLSHVERYFADFLSVMESGNNITLYPDSLIKTGIPSNIKLSNNLFIIGTVNIDETTYMFSPKVLDRANAIEFRIKQEEISLFLNERKELKMAELTGKGSNMASSFLGMANNKIFEDKDLITINNTLVNFFSELKRTGAEFGFRSASEIHRLLNQLSLMDKDISEDEKLDIAIMQKLLPKLHGSRRKLCPVLITLGKFCVTDLIANVEKDVFEANDFDFSDRSKIRYPLTLEKLSRMYKGAVDNGFASFAEA